MQVLRTPEKPSLKSRSFKPNEITCQCETQSLEGVVTEKEIIKTLKCGSTVHKIYVEV